MFPKSRNEIPPMSVESATEYVRIMVQRESRGPGDLDNAMHRIEAKYGLPFWSLWHLRKGKAKSCEVSLYNRVRGAYLDMCQRQASNLLHEIELEVAAGDDTNRDLADRLRAMAADLETKGPLK